MFNTTIVSNITNDKIRVYANKLSENCLLIKDTDVDIDINDKVIRGSRQGYVDRFEKTTIFTKIWVEWEEKK